ncbi:MAG: hypothetical protein K6T63_03740 [Alicyclobacillus herbarius]|uniref:hypothetical protein n=1 Tax=Alicyclobacillus herbarius TaxID=122960 RepID=UPI0004189809|nr:hypothetical protein [Alicyclobacillus herbarius]MCL6631722.1 hypothetical protein [Alicyclobacillus herbarius]
MNHIKSRWMLYSLYALLFAFVLLGIVLHSYPLLIALVVIGIALAVLADKLENEPSEPFKRYNEQHHRLHQ